MKNNQMFQISKSPNQFNPRIYFMHFANPTADRHNTSIPEPGRTEAHRPKQEAPATPQHIHTFTTLPLMD